MFKTSRLFHLNKSNLKRNFSTNTLKLTFGSPHSAICVNKVVKNVTLPGADGSFEVGYSSRPVISFLIPGLVAVTDLNNTREKYFVSAGSVVMSPDSVCSLSVTEAVPISQIDPDAARIAFDAANQEFSNATTDEARATAAISVQIYRTMLYALDPSS
eukprot:TRINITY_DN74_c0_g1_i1.p1 TRINITY_DN74_c0_g1~~TRINITY_DN74_c0_g1_i1.p1  ORF type:complete len:158 (-),score=58.41 TRINITY_DN74_c0_g1_i1:365-838(-)